MTNNTKLTAKAEAKKTVTITLYKKDYTFNVDSDLSKNIKQAMFEANRGRKGYRTPSVELIRERLVSKFCTITEQGVRTLCGVKRKVEFSSKETAGYVTPFVIAQFN